MISLRYHIVSIVAVFLALALGIVMGTTVVDRGVAAGLRARFQGANARASKLEADKLSLQRELSLWEGFGRSLVPSLVRGRLAGRTATLLVQDGADGGVIDDVRDGLAAAGAVVQGRVRLSDKWALDQEPAREQLALVTGLAIGDGARLLRESAGLLGLRLGAPSDPHADGDLLAELSRTGFLAVEDVPDGRPFPSRGALLVVVPAGDGRVKTPEQGFLLPLLRALAEDHLLAVAERTDAKHFVSDAVRGDRALSRAVVTVDHADTMPGALALVYALADLGAGRPAVHYGIRGGAAGVVPPLA